MAHRTLSAKTRIVPAEPGLLVTLAGEAGEVTTIPSLFLEAQHCCGSNDF